MCGETCASQCVSESQPSLRLVERTCAEWPAPRVASVPCSACWQKPSRRFREDALPSPLQKSVGSKAMNGNGLLRRLGLARTNDTIDDGARYVHRPLGKINVTPSQAEQFALP